MQDFVCENGAVLEHSAPHFHSSNSVAETHVRIAKRILKKSASYEDFQDSLARYRNCPYPLTQKRLSVLFFACTLPEPDLSELPLPLTLSADHELVLEKKLANSQWSQDKRELDQLNVGQCLLIQEPVSSTWHKAGTIISLDKDFERSYMVKRDGRQQPVCHNRIHLQPLASAAAQAGEGDSKAAILLKQKKKVTPTLPHPTPHPRTPLRTLFT